ncbi:MAG: BMP family ABC transporter substrate-binding protein [Tetrasphaera sp.]|nr:BMP family ABC transporter substrate-binding protein [Tetrasphaera sp.]
MALAGCGGSTSKESTTAGGSSSATSGSATSSSAAASDVKVGMAYDVGGRGDQSFNDAAAAGLDKAKADFGIDIKEATAVNGENEAAREERLNQLVDAGYTNIVAVGFAYAASVGKVAKENPDVHFAIIDDASDASKAANVAQLTFAENEGSFLVGAAAALKSKAGHIGFVGGVNVPLIVKFQAGFEAGAKAVNPKIKIDSTYLTQPPDFSGFGDPAKGKTAAEGMFQGGADVVYHAAGGSGAGVFTAAKAAKAWAIGVDSDQAKTAEAGVRDVILTSMLKKVDVAVYDYLSKAVKGEAAAGNIVYDLKADGVGYSTTGGHIDDIVAKLDEYKAKIISGEIKVPATM